MPGDDGDGRLVLGPTPGIGRFGIWHGEFGFLSGAQPWSGLPARTAVILSAALHGSKKRGMACLEFSRRLEQAIPRKWLILIEKKIELGESGRRHEQSSARRNSLLFYLSKSFPVARSENPSYRGK